MSRTDRIEIRLSPAERRDWQQAADAEERSLSDWIRRSVNTSLRRHLHGSTQPEIIPPRHWPVSETVPQEDRETVLTKTVEIESLTQSREEAAPPVALGSCRMMAFHVKGRYCKVCGTVPE